MVLIYFSIDFVYFIGLIVVVVVVAFHKFNEVSEFETRVQTFFHVCQVGMEKSCIDCVCMCIYIEMKLNSFATYIYKCSFLHNATWFHTRKCVFLRKFSIFFFSYIYSYELRMNIIWKKKGRTRGT